MVSFIHLSTNLLDRVLPGASARCRQPCTPPNGGLPGASSFPSSVGGQQCSHALLHAGQPMVHRRHRGHHRQGGDSSGAWPGQAQDPITSSVVCTFTTDDPEGVRSSGQRGRGATRTAKGTAFCCEASTPSAVDRESSRRISGWQRVPWAGTCHDDQVAVGVLSFRDQSVHLSSRAHATQVRTQQGAKSLGIIPQLVRKGLREGTDFQVSDGDELRSLRFSESHASIGQG